MERSAPGSAGDTPGLRGSSDRLRLSSESIPRVQHHDEVILTETTGTVGLIFIEQKDGIVVLMCDSSPPMPFEFLHDSVFKV